MLRDPGTKPYQRSYDTLRLLQVICDRTESRMATSFPSSMAPSIGLIFKHKFAVFEHQLTGTEERSEIAQLKQAADKERRHANGFRNTADYIILIASKRSR
jgi:hypothetical protein